MRLLPALCVLFLVGCGGGGGSTAPDLDNPLAVNGQAAVYSVTPTGTIGRVGDVVTFTVYGHEEVGWSLGVCETTPCYGREGFDPWNASPGSSRIRQFPPPDLMRHELDVELLKAGTYNIEVWGEVPPISSPEERARYRFEVTILP